MKEKGKERSQFYYTGPTANFASEGLDASQSIPIKPSIYHFHRDVLPKEDTIVRPLNQNNSIGARRFFLTYKFS
jgi:hypothetical protein